MDYSSLVDQVDTVMRELVMPSGQKAWFGEVLEYLMQTKGKKIRPEWSFRIQGLMRLPLHPKSVEVAALVEILHLASLLHDDVIDRAPRRRGKESVNSQWGDAVAILVGDYLLSRLFQQMVCLKSYIRLEHFAWATQYLSSGSLLELNARFRPDLSLQQYYQIIAWKTASLFALASSLACDLSRAPPLVSKVATQMGWHFGLSFQIVDDILDFQKDGSTGKPPFQDLRTGLLTMPILLAREDGKENPLFARMAESPENWQDLLAQNEEEILKWVYDSKGIERAQKEAEYHLSLIQVYAKRIFKIPEEDDFIEWVKRSIWRKK
ncbi:MAG: polyprenyl synthetase family protein [bacterium JZ-2024 1]